jgi:hypothetical protein
MTDLGLPLRRALASHPRVRGSRFPIALRKRVVDYARCRRAEGASWARVASEIGLRFETIRRWCAASNAGSPPRALVPVEVVAEARAVMTVVSRSGIRIEGATLADVIELLRALG